MFQPPPKNLNYRARIIVVGLIVAVILVPAVLIALDRAGTGSIFRSFNWSSVAPYISRDGFNELPDDKKAFEADNVCRSVELPEELELLQTSTNFVTPTRASLIHRFRTQRPDDEIMAFFRATLARRRQQNPATGKFENGHSSVDVLKTGEDDNGSVYEMTCDRWESRMEFGD